MSRAPSSRRATRGGRDSGCRAIRACTDRAHRIARAVDLESSAARSARATAIAAEHDDRRAGVDVGQLASARSTRGRASSPRARSASSVAIGVPIRRWTFAITSSRRSSDSTSSHRPPPALGEPRRNAALTAWSMPSVNIAHVAQARRELAQDLVLVADLAVGDEHDHALAIVVAAGEQLRPRSRSGAASSVPPRASTVASASTAR